MIKYLILAILLIGCSQPSQSEPPEPELTKQERMEKTFNECDFSFIESNLKCREVKALNRIADALEDK